MWLSLFIVHNVLGLLRNCKVIMGVDKVSSSWGVWCDLHYINQNQDEETHFSFPLFFLSTYVLSFSHSLISPSLDISLSLGSFENTSNPWRSTSISLYSSDQDLGKCVIKPRRSFSWFVSRIKLGMFWILLKTHLVRISPHSLHVYV